MRFKITNKVSASLVASLVVISGLVSADTSKPNGRLLATQCFQCHNGQGGATGFDSITGESVSEIVGELNEMKAKAKTEAEIMHSQAAIYTSDEIKAIAEYLATLPKGVGD